MDSTKTPSADARTSAEGKDVESFHSLSTRPSIPHSGPTTRSQRWKALERTAARKLRGERIHRRLFERAPDVVVPDFQLILECKAYRKFSHHTLIETADRKYAEPGETTVLVTKAQGQIGEYCTVSLDWLAGLLDEVREARR